MEPLSPRFPATADLIMSSVIRGTKFVKKKDRVPSSGLFYVMPCIDKFEVAAFRFNQFKFVSYTHKDFWKQVVSPLLVSIYFPKSSYNEKEALRESVKDLYLSIPYGVVDAEDACIRTGCQLPVDCKLVADQFFVPWYLVSCKKSRHQAKEAESHAKALREKLGINLQIN